MGKMKDVHTVAISFYCEWVGGIVRVNIEDTWVGCNADPCGRYEAEVYAEFKCTCGRPHDVSLKFPYERMK